MNQHKFLRTIVVAILVSIAYVESIAMLSRVASQPGASAAAIPVLTSDTSR